MKVLHIGHSKGWRGGENQVRLLVEGLIYEYSDIENYIAYPNGALAIDRLSGMGSGILEFSSPKILSVSTLYRLISFCQLHHIDILHAHSARAHSLAYFTKFFISKIKVVVHRRVDSRIKKSFFTRKKYLSNKIDAFIAISDKTRNSLVSYDVDEQRLFLVKDGIPSQDYTFTSKHLAKNHLIDSLGWDAELPLIGFVAALDHSKNPLLFVDLVFQLKQRGIKVNTVMAGTGKMQATVKNAIESLDLSENIQLLGFVDQVQDVFHALDIFVLPSRHEGLGTVLLEASLAECVVVASDVGGISEVVKHQQTGLLAESGSVETFVQAMQYILENPSVADQMKNNAKQFVTENFKIKTVVAKTRDVYMSVCAKN